MDKEDGLALSLIERLAETQETAIRAEAEARKAGIDVMNEGIGHAAEGAADFLGSVDLGGGIGGVPMPTYTPEQFIEWSGEGHDPRLDTYKALLSGAITGNERALRNLVALGMLNPPITKEDAEWADREGISLGELRQQRVSRDLARGVRNSRWFEFDEGWIGEADSAQRGLHDAADAVAPFLTGWGLGYGSLRAMGVKPSNLGGLVALWADGSAVGDVMDAAASSNDADDQIMLVNTWNMLTGWEVQAPEMISYKAIPEGAPQVEIDKIEEHNKFVTWVDTITIIASILAVGLSGMGAFRAAKAMPKQMQAVDNAKKSLSDVSMRTDLLKIATATLADGQQFVDRGAISQEALDLMKTDFGNVFEEVGE